MKGVKIVVCAKQIPDPEAPLGAVKIDPERKKVSVEGLSEVINPYDENALEAALQIKEKNGGEVTVLSMGDKVSPSVLRKVLAVGADKLIFLEDQYFGELASSSRAYVLFSAIQRIGEYDLILTGRQAGDWDSGQTGLILGEMLRIATISLARRVEIEDGNVVVEKIIPGGYELVRAGMPALITVSNEVGEIRSSSMKGMLQSRRQPIEVWGAKDIQINPNDLRKMQIIELSPPADIGRQCHFMEGDSPEEKGENLAIALKAYLQ